MDGVEVLIELLYFFCRACFFVPHIFCSLVPRKKHSLRLVEIELSVQFSPPFAITFSVSRNYSYSMKKKYLLLLAVLLITNIKAQITFQPFTNIYTPSWSEIVKIGDVNNDGLNDVVLGLVSYVGGDQNLLLVFYQNQNGTLDSPLTISYFDNYKNLEALEIGDINQDGLNDIVIGYSSNLKGGNYGFIIQNSDGSLSNLISYDAQTYEFQNLKIGDLNDDGVNDIIMATYNSFYFLYQTTPGNFIKIVKPKIFNLGSYVNASNMEIADVNNDGKNDLVTNDGSRYKMYTYLQINSTTFGDPIITDYNYLNYSYNCLAVGDLNGDGRTDVALSRGPNYTSKIGILYQIDSPNLFSNFNEIPAYDLPEPIKISDLDNDGKNEIITVHGGWNNASIYEQDISGNYNSYQLLPLPYASSYDREGLAVGDINNDGKKDIVIANYNRGLDILYNSSTLSSIDYISKEEIIIYPNPTDNFIFLKSRNKYPLYSIFDMSGREIDKGVIKNNSISCKHLESGQYILRLFSNKKIKNIKFTKK